MTEWMSTGRELSGPVHSGPGIQNNYIGIHNPVDFRRSNPRQVALDDLNSLHEIFVCPPRFLEAADRLMTLRTVLLGGPPGSGRTTTAKMLLHHLATPVGRIHEILPEQADGSGISASERVGSGDQMWIDLSNLDRDIWPKIQGEMLSLRSVVLRRDAYLVIVLPDENSDVSPEFRRFYVRPGKPAAGAVLRSHLDAVGIGNIGDKLTLDRLNILLGSSPSLNWTARLASLLHQAREIASQDDGMDSWIARVEDSLQDHSKAISDLVVRRNKGPQRALLLAVAFMHGAPADQVLRAADELLDATGYSGHENSLLEKPDLMERLPEIEARSDLDGRVHFEKIGYGAAVGAHYWEYRPDLRSGIISWVTRILRSDAYSRGTKDGLLGSFADQYLRDGRRNSWGDLAKLSVEWARHKSTSDAARRLLGRALADDTAGPTFRRQIYEWSQLAQLELGLVRVLTNLCEEVIAVRHPDQAVVRLHHLVRRHGRKSPEPRRALLALVESDQGARRLMLQRLTRRLPPQPDQREPRQWDIDVEIFLDIVDPAQPGWVKDGMPLLHEKEVQEHLASCWDAAFSAQDQAVAVRRRVVDWFVAASVDSHHRAALLDVLVAACSGQIEALARLHTWVRSWSAYSGGERSGRTESIANDLLKKISVAQGIPAELL